MSFDEALARTATPPRMKRIRFAVTYPPEHRHPIQRRLTESPPVSRVELLIWSPTPDATTLLWCDGDDEAATDLLDALASVTASTLLAGDGGTYVFLQQRDYEFAAPIMDLIATAAVVFLPPVVFRSDGTIQFEAVGPTSALSTFHDDLASLGSLTIERVADFQRDGGSSLLTDRQLSALGAGVDVGYYDIPRTGTVADVASELDCAKSTAGELLRKAEAAVVRDLVETTS